MTLLTVVNDVCAAVGVHQATSVVANINANRTMFEMLALANEMAARIATDMRDWTVLRKPVTFVGDGVPVAGVLTGTEAFNLPADYQRMLTNSHVWRSTSTLQPMRFVPNTDEWLQRRSANWSDAWGEWTIYGGQMHIWPIMAKHTSAPWQNSRQYQTLGELAVDTTDQTLWQVAAKHSSAAVGTTFAQDRTANPSFWSSPVQTIDAVTARFSYLDKNPIALSGFSDGLLHPGDRFVADGDSYRLPERILKLGMIWQWQANKGSPYAESMGTWGDAMANAMGTDSPGPIIIDRLPISAHARTAYPWMVPTP